MSPYPSAMTNRCLCLATLLLAVFTCVIGSDKLYFRRDYVYLKDYAAFFKFHKNIQNFTEAIGTCNAEGAQLYFPSSQEESTAIFNMINNTNVYFYWIGVHDLFGESAFVTLDGESVDDHYSNWGPGEPNNVGGNEHCVIVRRDNTFNDDDCNQKRHFVCKKNATNLTQNPICETYDLDYTYNVNMDKCYKFHLVPLSWQNAYKTCKAEEAQLVILNSEDEAKLLVKEWAKHPDSSIPGNFDRTVVHLGFNELLSPGSYMTTDGKPLWTTGYQKWSPGQPDNRDGVEHCGSMFRDGTLNDVDCSFRALFFCEKALSENKILVMSHGAKPGTIVELPDA